MDGNGRILAGKAHKSSRTLFYSFPETKSRKASVSFHLHNRSLYRISNYTADNDKAFGLEHKEGD
jgi:hypothetical protein